MQLKRLLGFGLAFMTFAASAQLMDADPDWKEVEAPPPPSFSKDRLIPIDMPPYVSLRFGVDPASLSITDDGVVRYVMVATSSSGSINAMYEGIRCATGEVKTYARYNSAGQWAAVQEPQWRSLFDNMPSKHALALARQGACEGRTTARSVTAIVNALKYPQQTLGN